jgi:hypothetical protein
MAEVAGREWNREKGIFEEIRSVHNSFVVIASLETFPVQSAEFNRGCGSRIGIRKKGNLKNPLVTR